MHPAERQDRVLSEADKAGAALSLDLRSGKNRTAKLRSGGSWAGCDPVAPRTQDRYAKSCAFADSETGMFHVSHPGRVPPVKPGGGRAPDVVFSLKNLLCGLQAKLECRRRHGQQHLICDQLLARPKHPPFQVTFGHFGSEVSSALIRSGLYKSLSNPYFKHENEWPIFRV